MKKVLIVLFLFLSLYTIFPNSFCNDIWNYENYLSNFMIVTYDDTVIAGNKGILKLEICSNTNIVVHGEFKGHFTWGDWIYSSSKLQLESGCSTIDLEVEIPWKAAIEPTSEFYFYVYVTLPTDKWNPEVWGLAQTVNVENGNRVSHKELLAYLNHIKWLIDTSDLNDGVKKSIISKLDTVSIQINKASSNNKNNFESLIGKLNAVLNELDSANKASSYPDSDIWKNQIKHILKRIQLLA